MSGSAIRHQVGLLISGALSQKAIAATFAKEARSYRDGLIRKGETISPSFDTYVDGRKGAPEETVRIGGNVLYVFNSMSAAVSYAYSFAVFRSPRKTGRFQRSWIIGVNGRNYTGHIEDIPPDATVTLVNIQPYSRRLDVGRGHKITLASHITEDTRQATGNRFPQISAQRIFVELPSTLSSNDVVVPYILGGFAHIRPGRRRPRADTAKGAVMTYPAVLLSPK